MKISLDHTKIIITRTRRKILKTTLIILAVIVVISVALYGLALTNKNKVVHGLKLVNISVGGLSIDGARTKINKATKEFLEEDIVLKYENENEYKIWTALPEELGIKIDIDSTLSRLAKIGHQGKFFSDLGQQILALFGHYNLVLNYQINERRIENFIKEKLDSINNPAVNASWQYDETINKFVQIPSQKGMIVDQRGFKLQLYNKIEGLAKDDIFLSLINDHPEILENETTQAYNKTEEILTNAPYSFIINDPLKDSPIKIPFTKEETISLIEFRSVPDKDNPKNKVLGTTFNEQALKDYLIMLSPSINRNPADAQLTVQRNRVTDFILSQNGLKLEIEKNVFKLKENILAGNKEIELEVSIVPPKIATKDIDNLGIVSFLGKGVSNFAGSPNNRIHNIKIGAAKFHGLLMKPGEEFSFNTILGEIGPEQGYQKELVIKRTKTIPEYGGGLCQVSTTAFRTAINAGLSITERYPHAFPVVYYSPQGFDATVYPPHPDLRFINNTPSHLLIQTKVEGYYLTFEFYGTDDGRKIEIDGPHQYDIKPDGSMKTKLTRKIFRHGELVEEKTWNSSYKSPDLYPVQRNPLE
jgi:vancomycin resistance protein YoaR